MRILILCGGQGTRLAAASGDLPKPMISIGGRPILWHIMKGFAHHGFRDFVLCLGFRSEMIKQYFLNLTLMVNDVTIDHGARHEQPSIVTGSDEMNWRITLAETGQDSMTGYRVRSGAAHLSDDDDIFAVTYGDGVSDIDFNRVVAFHRAHGKMATLTAVHPPGRFGELQLGPQGEVQEFNEKPQASSGWISGGFFVFSRAFIDRLADDPRLVLEQQPLQQLAREGQLVAYRHDSFWYCVDTPRDYQQLSQLWEGGAAPWATWIGR